METKKSFHFYATFLDHLSLIEDIQERWNLLEAIAQYGTTKTFDKKLSPRAEMAMSFFIEILNRDWDKYNKICERNKKNSHKLKNI